MEPPKLSLNRNQSQNIKQMQRLIMSQEMQQALEFLELPIMELQPLIEREIEQNPLLETFDEEIDTSSNENEDQIAFDENDSLSFDERNFKIMEELDEEFKNHFNESGPFQKSPNIEDDKLKNYLESLIVERKSLFTHLMEQARELFASRADLKMAESLIGNLDDHGFLTLSLTEIGLLTGVDSSQLEAILKKIQTLEPKGIGAVNLQESLLLQLQLAKKEESLAYLILKDHYKDFLKGRFIPIAKLLKVSKVGMEKAVAEIKKLNLNPGLSFSSDPIHYIIPDITIAKEGDSFTIFVNEDPLPPLKLNKRYLSLLNDETLKKETKEFIEKKIASAKWMIRNLTERNETLVKIAHLLVKKQKKFLDEKRGLLTPLTMKEIAEELGINESTVTRAVSHKYMNTPKGLMSLRSFFTNGYIGQDGTSVSSEEVKAHIMELVQNEEKKKPLSDASLAKMIEKKGLACARRTVAKYRNELGLRTAKQRKT